MKLPLFLIASLSLFSVNNFLIADQELSILQDFFATTYTQEPEILQAAPIVLPEPVRILEVIETPVITIPEVFVPEAIAIPEAPENSVEVIETLAFSPFLYKKTACVLGAAALVALLYHRKNISKKTQELWKKHGDYLLRLTLPLGVLVGGIVWAQYNPGEPITALDREAARLLNRNDTLASLKHCCRGLVKF